MSSRLGLLPVAILAGGLATRLRPVTKSIPKSLVTVAGRPFIDWQLEWLGAEGVAEVTLCLGHLGELVREAVGDGSRFGLDVTYSFDGDRPMGTGGALVNALPRLGNAFFVLYGDSYLQCSFGEVQAAFLASAKPALMTVIRNEGKWDKSNADYRSGQVTRYSKSSTAPNMSYIDYGLSVLRADALSGKDPQSAFDLAELFESLSGAGQLAGVEVTRRFYEIGSFAGLAETEEFLSRHDQQETR